MISIISKISEKKSKLTIKQLVIHSFFGGVFVAFGALLSVMIAGNMPELLQTNPGVVKFVFGALFPLGLILVALMNAELFTGNNSYLIVGVMAKRITWLDLSKNLAWVFVFNFIGALFIAYFFGYYTELINPSQQDFLVKIGESKTKLPFDVVLVRAIACNWLVCLALWMAAKTESITGKIVVIWLPIMAFVAMGFEHSIANMFFIPLAMFFDANISFQDFFIGNLLPVTIGNNIGGGFFVGMLYYFSSKKEIN